MCHTRLSLSLLVWILSGFSDINVSCHFTIWLEKTLSYAGCNSESRIKAVFKRPFQVQSANAEKLESWLSELDKKTRRHEFHADKKFFFWRTSSNFFSASSAAIDQRNRRLKKCRHTGCFWLKIGKKNILCTEEVRQWNEALVRRKNSGNSICQCQNPICKLVTGLW